MSGWFKSQSAYEWAVATFRKRQEAIEKSTDEEQLAFDRMLSMYWHAFIAKHGSPAGFAQLRRDEQMDYFTKMVTLQAIFFDDKAFEKAVPLEMLNIYLSAIINKHRTFEVEAANFLEEHVRRSDQLLPP